MVYNRQYYQNLTKPTTFIPVIVILLYSLVVNELNIPQNG